MVIEELVELSLKTGHDFQTPDAQSAAPQLTDHLAAEFCWTNSLMFSQSYQTNGLAFLQDGNAAIT